MEYDALTAGVNPGGLNNIQQIRLLVCYMLRSVKSPLQRKIIPELLQYEGLANYFEVTQAIDDLAKRNNITIDENDCLTLGATGLEAINEWEFILPYTVKEKAVRATVSLLTKKRIAEENKVTITPLENGFNVLCTVLDGKNTLMSVMLWVPEKAQAESVRDTFMNDPMSVYSGNIALLTGNYSFFKGDDKQNA